MIEDIAREDNIIEIVMEVYTSWIDEYLSDYNTDFYYQSRDYIAACYREKEII